MVIKAERRYVPVWGLFIYKSINPFTAVSQLCSVLQEGFLLCTPGSHVSCLPASNSQWEVLVGDWRVGEREKPGCISLSLSVSGSFYSRALFPP